MRMLIALPLLALLAAPAASQERESGKIGVLAQGKWSCAVPGIASAEARFLQTDRDFETIRGSRYKVGDVIGTYLRLGDTITMTSGAFEGRTYRAASEKRLRETEDGADTAVRCIHVPT
ncbi:hypothetical protein [Pseudoblastomonas halimionae]|uniref:Elongation factor P n=1 Tax=Alteriqipengyuania halimionae TaxID=1926630 RepID=A0A6I4U270_9SPHN|nr:hypothetical protein [Alteriqipengyuania halimionae]MXP09394.1 hypothetical protein [Alteriqipengyuania halimionae]